MITPELRARIRRLFYAEHWKIGTIASELDVHHETVRRAIESDRFVSHGTVVRPSILDPYKALVLDTLKKHPRLRSTRLYDMIRERGYEGSVVQLRRWVKTVRPTTTEAYLRLETLPGEQAQVDWGHFGRIQIGKASRRLSCFVMVLAWSRATYAHFFLDQKMESFLRGHVLAFEALGGVPRSVLYDNLKSVVIDRVGEHVQFHSRLLELAGHYHFAPKPCAPYRANEKPRVERRIRDIRDSFFAARRIDTLSALNEQLADWIERVVHTRPVPADDGKRTVEEALAEEQPRLLPLPENPLSCAEVRPIKSGKTPYVRYDLNDYSIPHTLVRKPLTLVATEDCVRITTPSGDVVAEHQRSYDRAKLVEDQAHIEELAREKRRARELRGRQRLTNACPRASELLEQLARRGEPLRPQTARLNRLLERYGADELIVAIADVLERGAANVASVAHILDQRARARGEPPPLDVVLPDDPRVRDLVTNSHDLSSYDSLGRKKPKKEP